MKKILFLSLVFFAFAAYAGDDLEIRAQMLRSEIEQLTAVRDEKYTALKQCEKNTEGFKVAGLATLVATEFGIYANVKLTQKLNGKSGASGGDMDVNSLPPPSPQQNLMDLCTQFPKECE